MLNFLSNHVFKMQLYIFIIFLDKKKNNFEWTIEHQKRFAEMKILLAEQISNTIPYANQPFSAMYDASNFGISAAFLQSLEGTNKMNVY